METVVMRIAFACLRCSYVFFFFSFCAFDLSVVWTVRVNACVCVLCLYTRRCAQLMGRFQIRVKDVWETSWSHPYKGTTLLGLSLSINVIIIICIAYGYSAYLKRLFNILLFTGVLWDFDVLIYSLLIVTCIVHLFIRTFWLYFINN